MPLGVSSLKGTPSSLARGHLRRLTKDGGVNVPVQRPSIVYDKWSVGLKSVQQLPWLPCLKGEASLAREVSQSSCAHSLLLTFRVKCSGLDNFICNSWDCEVIALALLTHLG